MENRPANKQYFENLPDNKQYFENLPDNKQYFENLPDNKQYLVQTDSTFRIMPDWIRAELQAGRLHYTGDREVQLHHIPYSGKLSRDKTFANFEPFVKVFSANFVGVATH